MDYLCAKFSDFSFSRFGFLSCRHTDRQITEELAHDCYTHVNTVGISMGAGTGEQGGQAPTLEKIRVGMAVKM